MIVVPVPVPAHLLAAANHYRFRLKTTPLSHYLVFLGCRQGKKIRVASRFNFACFNYKSLTISCFTMGISSAK